MNPPNRLIKSSGVNDCNNIIYTKKVGLTVTSRQNDERGIIRILYVDDDEDNLLVAKAFLEMEPGFKVETVSDPSSAFIKVCSGEADVVVSDLLMPGKDGIGLLKDIRDSGLDIPFIIISARGREDVVLRAFSEGADYYVQKGGEQRSQFIELAGKIRNSHISRVREKELCLLKTATEASIDGIAILGSGLNISYCNNAFASIVGYPSADKLTGVPLDSFLISKKESDDLIKHITALGPGSHRLSRKTIALNDESAITVEISVSPLPEGGTILVVRNVEDLIKKESEVKSLNDTNSALLNSIPDRILLLDVDGGIGDNQQNEFLCISGKGPEGREVVAEEGINEDLREFISHNMEEMRRRGSVTPFNYVRESNGVSRYFEARMAFVNNQMLMVIERDVTELENAKKMAEYNERQSEESRRLLESILQTQTEMICRFNGDTTLTYVNDAYCRYFRKSPKELIGRRFLDFIPELWHVSILENLSQLTPDDPIFNYAHEVVKEDGSIAWQEWTDTAFFTVDGDLLYIQSVGRDITEAVILKEEQERQSHFKEILIEILSDFIGSGREGYYHSVQDSLRQIGEFVGVDRVYTFNYDFHNNVCNNTHEWCADEIEPQIGNLQRVPLKIMEEWTRAHRSGDIIHISDVTSYWNDAVRSILEPQGVKSLLTIPLMDNTGCRGFVGFDSVRRRRDFNPTEISLLKIFADMLVVLNSRMEAERDLRHVNELNRTLIDNYPDVVYATDLVGNIIHISENVKDILGYSPDELKTMGLDFITGPREALERMGLENLQGMITTGDVSNIIRTPFDIQTKTGQIIRAETTNRLHQSEDGRWIIIGYARRVL